MSQATDKTCELFSRVALSDDGAGYPNHAEFLPGDQEWSGESLARNLREGQTSVVVFGDFAVVVTPQTRSGIAAIWSRISGRTPAHVQVRWHEQQAPFGFSTRLGSDPLAEMRELAHV